VSAPTDAGFPPTNAETPGLPLDSVQQDVAHELKVRT